MLDVSVSFKRFGFLGAEFVTWLWFITETQGDSVAEWTGESAVLDLGQRIVLENHRGPDTERVTIRGEAAQMDEAFLALKKGALVTEAHFNLEVGDSSWSFNIKADTLALSTLKCPSTGPVRIVDEVEGAVLEKMGLLEVPQRIIDSLFARFADLRTSTAWTEAHIPSVRKWIEQGGEAKESVE